MPTVTARFMVNPHQHIQVRGQIILQRAGVCILVSALAPRTAGLAFGVRGFHQLLCLAHGKITIKLRLDN